MNETSSKKHAKKAATVSLLKNIDDSSHFIHREISQMKFNERVLQQSLDERIPLLERLIFLLIFTSNLDEFFEVRIARLKLQMFYDIEKFGADGISPKIALKQLSQLCHELVVKQYMILNDILLPELERANVFFLAREEWSKQQRAWIKNYFDKQVAPVISPIALDPAHPFPRLVNKSLNFIVSLKGKDAFGRETRMAIVPAPRSLPRLIKLPKEDGQNAKDEFVFLSAIIRDNIDRFFHGMKATGCYQFRVTRNSDLNVNEKEATDIAAEVKGKLFNRRYGNAVRLEVGKDCPPSMRKFLLDQYQLTQQDLYEADGPVNLRRLFALLTMLDRPELEYPEFSPEMREALRPEKNYFDAIKTKDQLLLHPYSSFTPVLELLRQAAKDPAVVSIKQTLYRCGRDAEIASILEDAARNGKEVTVVIELKARFDEQQNLALASGLQESGAVVCYGVVGHKTHAKMMLILRREEDELVHYAHLGTGNYHARNAKIYTDYSLFTANKEICADIHHIFQQLTGMGKTMPMTHIFHAPFTLTKNILRLIDEEIKAAKAGKAAKIILKVNNLTDKVMVLKLYEASQAGVEIDLIVRGMCVLRPGIAGLSENIRVKSIVGRFLEHNRVYYFLNANPSVYCSSADLMERNLRDRIEICFPILSAKLAETVLNDLYLFIADKGQSWILDSQGEYHLADPHSSEKTVQQILLDRHCQSAVVN